jgi:hypothetical protein
MFAEWLEEMIWWDENQYVPRYMAVGKFVSEGLYPFITENGYVIQKNMKTFAKNVARLLYINRGESCLSGKFKMSEPENATRQHLWHFYNTFSEEKWEIFWRQWAIWDDLNDFRGHDRQIDIQALCWSQLNLDESPQTKVVNELMGVEDEIKITPGKMDDTFDTG